MSAGQRPTAVRCERCGAESILDTGFVKERRSFRLRSHQYCPPCADERERRTSFRAWIVNFALLGATAIWLGQLWLALNTALFLMFSLLLTIPHELGHAIAARSTGLYVFNVVIGIGRTVWKGKVLGFPWELKSFPVGGVTLVFPRGGRAVRSRIFVTTLAGPAVNFILLVAGLQFLGWPGGEDLVESPAPVMAFLLASSWCAFVTLLPFRMRTVVGQSWSDGGLLLSLPFWRRERIEEALAGYFGARALRSRDEEDPEGAERWAREGLARYPESAMVMSVLGLILLDARRYDDALELYRPLLFRSDVKPEVRALVLNNIAYTEFLIGRRDLLDEADRFSQEALAQMHWQPAFLGTRGAVLIALGRTEEGLPLLQRAFGAPSDDRSKALNACAMAIGLLQRGDQDGAERMTATARRLDPTCILLDRVRAEA